MKIAPFAGSASGLLGFGGWATVGHSYATGQQSKSSVPVDLSFSTDNGLGDFQGGICVNTLLSQEAKALLNKGGINEDEWKNLNDKFKNPRGETKGCLAVSWERTLGNNGLWGGVIKYEWMFTKGHETMVVNGFYDVNELHKKNWRAIYINTETQKKAWNLWLIRKHHMPRNPFSSPLKNSVHPDYGNVCFLESCKNLTWKEPYYGARWMWREDQAAENAFADWSDFKELTEGTDTLPELRALMGRENGTWESF